MSSVLISTKKLSEAADQARTLPTQIEDQDKIIEFIDHFRKIVENPDVGKDQILTDIRQKNLNQIHLPGLIRLMKHYCGEEKLAPYRDEFIEKACQYRSYQDLSKNGVELDLSAVKENKNWLIADESYAPGRFEPYCRDQKLKERRHHLHDKTRLYNYFRDNREGLKIGPNQAQECVLDKLRLLLTSFHTDKPEVHHGMLDDELEDIETILTHFDYNPHFINNIKYLASTCHHSGSHKILQPEEIIHYINYLEDERPDLIENSSGLRILAGIVPSLVDGRLADSKNNSPYVFLNPDGKRYLRQARRNLSASLPSISN